MDETVLTIILAVFASSGFWAFLTELVSKPRQRALLESIAATNGRIDALEKAQTEDRRERQREREADQDARRREAADQAREEILRVSDELYVGVKHSKEFFDMTLAKIDIYEDFCRSHPTYQNSKATLAISRIKGIYMHLEDTNGFL